MPKDCNRPVYLVGFMGAGKSTVGRLLARSLGCPFVDLDAAIAATAGESIAEIFRRQGEAGFRALESAVLRGLPEVGRQVVATGGGIVERPENLDYMRRNGTILHLSADWESLRKRLEGCTERPLANPQQGWPAVEALYRRRQALYAGAEAEFDTTESAPAECAARITRYLQGNG